MFKCICILQVSNIQHSRPICVVDLQWLASKSITDQLLILHLLSLLSYLSAQWYKITNYSIEHM